MERPGAATSPAARVLIAGVSTRAAATSAARAGFTVTAIDAFGDLDQHPSVRNRSLGRRFTAHAAARAGRGIECDAVAYLSSFENHPNAVTALAAGRALWGNAPAVLWRVRDPLLVAEALGRRGIAAPIVHVAPESADLIEAADLIRSDLHRHRWLVKPLKSGGGHRVRAWRRGTLIPRGCYLQELVEGTPGSVVFVAAGGRAVPLAVSRQIVGDHAFGAAGYRYCGNILATGDVELVDRACALARAVAEDFDLVGVNGVDFIARGGVPYAIEVNPRWSSSMDLVERACGLSVFGAHVAACVGGTLPAFDLAQVRCGPGGPGGIDAVGKAVVFARRNVTVGDTTAWLVGRGADEAGGVGDVPRPGDRMAAGRPVCTVYASGVDEASCYAALVGRAERVYADLAAWERQVA